MIEDPAPTEPPRVEGALCGEVRAKEYKGAF
jgi:hypothetical protein